MCLPICITTYERVDYLRNTIECLESTNCDLSKLYIFDDGSIDPEKKDFMCDISKKYKVIARDANYGTYIATRFAISYVLDHNHDAKYIIHLQDDIELTKKWYEFAVEIMDKAMSQHERFGILSIYNRQWKNTEDYHIMKQGHTGGVAWVINPEFWTKYVNKFTDGLEHIPWNDSRENHHRRNLCDWKIMRAAHELNWKIGYTGKSLVQHVGDTSSLPIGNDMKYCRTDNYVGFDCEELIYGD